MLEANQRKNWGLGMVQISTYLYNTVILLKVQKSGKLVEVDSFYPTIYIDLNQWLLYIPGGAGFIAATNINTHKNNNDNTDNMAVIIITKVMILLYCILFPFPWPSFSNLANDPNSFSNFCSRERFLVHTLGPALYDLRCSVGLFNHIIWATLGPFLSYNQFRSSKVVLQDGPLPVISRVLRYNSYK